MRKSPERWYDDIKMIVETEEISENRDEWEEKSNDYIWYCIETSQRKIGEDSRILIQILPKCPHKGRAKPSRT